MVSPTDKEVVSGRFGKFRGGGAGNFGSANQTPHMHDGLDFSTSGASQPLYATTDGTIVYIGLRGTAGNSILIERANGDIAAYYHMAGFASNLQRGSKVSAGQQIGLSGNTPSTSMTKHLHFTYGTAKQDEARAKAFASDAARGPFNPGQLPSVFNRQAGIGYKTDPAPYFCKAFPIQDGHPEHYPVLGRDTMEQHRILFGSTPPGGVSPNLQFDAGQVTAANVDVALARREGKEPADFLTDREPFGAVPAPPIGGYDTMSALEMMLTEGARRFSDASWNTSITQLSTRGLWVDYARAQGVGTYLSEAIYRKRQRIEGLLAVYTSQKTAGLRNQVQDARAQAQGNTVRADIK